MAIPLQSAVTQLFDFQNTALEDQTAQATANAQAAGQNAQANSTAAQGVTTQAQADALNYTVQGVRLQQQGDYAEAAQYGNAADVATNSATLADVAGQVQEYQNTRAVNQTVGAQRASVAAAGFSNSGSALALARSSFQQGYLQSQMTRIQTNTRQGGFLEEAAAARAEQAGAQMAGDVAGTTIGAYQAEQAATAAAAGGYADVAAGYRAAAGGYAHNAATYGTMSSNAQVSAVNLSNYLSGYLRTADQTDPDVQISRALLSGSSSPGAQWSVNSSGQLSYNGQTITGTGTGTGTGTRSTVSSQVGSANWSLGNRATGALAGGGWLRNQGFGLH